MNSQREELIALAIMLLFMIPVMIAPFWLMFKVFQGAYHLLVMLIDKI